ncbi:unnamed protein product [Parajaminaea phylloscopi]
MAPKRKRSDLDPRQQKISAFFGATHPAPGPVPGPSTLASASALAPTPGPAPGPSTASVHDPAATKALAQALGFVRHLSSGKEFSVDKNLGTRIFPAKSDAELAADLLNTVAHPEVLNLTTSADALRMCNGDRFVDLMDCRRKDVLERLPACPCHTP